MHIIPCCPETLYNYCTLSITYTYCPYNWIGRPVVLQSKIHGMKQENKIQVILHTHISEKSIIVSFRSNMNATFELWKIKCLYVPHDTDCNIHRNPTEM